MAKQPISVIDENTVKAMNGYAKEVLKRARRNLKIKTKIDGKQRITDNTGELAKSLTYKLVKSKGRLNIRFASSKMYAEFIEQGVKGSDPTLNKVKKSPFKFKSNNLAKGVVEHWIDTKPIRLRDIKTNKFVSPTEQAKKQAAFLIGRSIAQKGISPRGYFKSAIEETKKRFVIDLANGMVKDTFKNFEDILKNGNN